MKKKIFMVILVCVMLAVVSLSVYAVTEACSHGGGVAMGLYTHHQMGSGCAAYERHYCDRCNETLYTVDTTYNICPTWHTRYPNWQPLG